MNGLQRSVAHKREKRRIEEEKLKQEPKVDIIAEIFGLLGAIGIIVMVYIKLK